MPPNASPFLYHHFLVWNNLPSSFRTATACLGWSNFAMTPVLETELTSEIDWHLLEAAGKRKPACHIVF
jgi:hypothetical protein